LIHFSRAWALAAAKAETLEELQAAAATVHALVHVEMPLHVETCAAEGIPRAELEATPERRENLAYTRYVLEAGFSGDFLDLMAALAPCVLGYGEIGLRLAAQAGDTPYRPWIDTYGGDAFQGACRTAGSLIDSAPTRRLGEDWEAQRRWCRRCADRRAAAGPLGEVLAAPRALVAPVRSLPHRDPAGGRLLGDGPRSARMSGAPSIPAAGTRATGGRRWAKIDRSGWRRS